MRRLLDTNVYSAFKRGHPLACEIVRESSEVVLSAIVVGELMAGFRRGDRYVENARELDDFLGHVRVEMVTVGRSTADRFGRIYAALRAKGTPIPSNDMWIAAHALETGAELVSFDRHFREVDGLPWIELLP